MKAVPPSFVAEPTSAQGRERVCEGSLDPAGDTTPEPDLTQTNVRLFSPSPLSQEEMDMTAERLIAEASAPTVAAENPRLEHFGRIMIWQRDRIERHGGSSRHLLALWAHSAAMHGRPWHQTSMGELARLGMISRSRMSNLSGDLVKWGLLHRVEQGTWRGTTRPARFSLCQPPLGLQETSVPDRNTGTSVLNGQPSVPTGNTGASVLNGHASKEVRESEKKVDAPCCATDGCLQPAYRSPASGTQFDWCGNCYHTIIKPAREAAKLREQQAATPAPQIQDPQAAAVVADLAAKLRLPDEPVTGMDPPISALRDALRSARGKRITRSGNSVYGDSDARSE